MNRRRELVRLVAALIAIVAWIVAIALLNADRPAHRGPAPTAVIR